MPAFKKTGPQGAEPAPKCTISADHHAAETPAFLRSVRGEPAPGYGQAGTQQSPKDVSNSLPQA